VVSDNKLVEGLQPIGTVPDESVRRSKEIDHVVRTYAGVSKKGYAPYNPRKRNQDAIMMVEDAKTMTLLFGVLDGHGEAGDLVSHYITARLPDRTFANSKWETDPIAAIAAETARLEKAVLSGEAVSAPTFVPAQRAPAPRSCEAHHPSRLKRGVPFLPPRSLGGMLPRSAARGPADTRRAGVARSRETLPDEPYLP